jgi:hypothetical protein
VSTITVNVDDRVERQFREAAAMRFGKRKGHLGRALTEAMEGWANTGSPRVRRVIAMLEEGLDLGGVTYHDRGELHGRGTRR